MRSVQINHSQILFSKFFSSEDSTAVLSAIESTEGVDTVVFIDTMATRPLIETVKSLKEKGFKIVVRDHHGEKNAITGRQLETAKAVEKLKLLLTDESVISNREEHPACSSLITLGEFSAKGIIIVANNDPGGLTAAMKAAGNTYPGLDTDSVIFDGASSATELSEIGALFMKGIATLSSFDKRRPRFAENERMSLFSNFYNATQGDFRGTASLEAKIKVHEKKISVANELISTASEIAKGVVFVDTVDFLRYDPMTLIRGLEKDGVKIIITRKKSGPIAGIQYSIAVAKDFQKEINLQKFISKKVNLSLEVGIIFDTSFLLHASEKVWKWFLERTIQLEMSDFPEANLIRCGCGHIIGALANKEGGPFLCPICGEMN